ncbi:hypothetical protein SVIOM74S_05796 [Streptomyces violarus]
MTAPTPNLPLVQATHDAVEGRPGRPGQRIWSRS